MPKTREAATWRAVHNGTSWAVHGDCICGDVETTCDGTCNVPVASGLSEEQARTVAAMENNTQVQEFIDRLGVRSSRRPGPNPDPEAAPRLGALY